VLVESVIFEVSLSAEFALFKQAFRPHAKKTVRIGKIFNKKIRSILVPYGLRAKQ